MTRKILSIFDITSKRLTLFQRLIFLGILLNSCSSDESSDPIVETINSQAYAVVSISITDIDNHADASDIAVRFETPHSRDFVNTYKVMLVKQTSSSTFDETKVAELNTTQFYKLDSKEAIVISKAIRLPKDILDTDGEKIVENLDYKVAILSEFIVEGQSGAVLRFSPTFHLEPYAASVLTIPTNFSSTDGLDAITVDQTGNIYVSNFGVWNDGGTGSQVYKITPYGELTTFASGLNVPSGIVIDNQNSIYVNGNEGNTIFKISSDGNKTVHATSADGFAGLVLDDLGNIYTGGYRSSKILKVHPDGLVETIADDQRLIGTVGIAYHHESKSLYAGNYDSGLILKITIEGEISQLAQLTRIGYITEMNGFLYATLFNEHKIVQISLAGEASNIAGQGAVSQKDGSLNEATFNNPNGIIGDAEHNTLYVTEWGSPRVTKIQL